MKCEYILRDEFYDDYLMEELTPPEQSSFEQHLTTCEVCQVELNRQRSLLDGIREASHLEMKQEILRHAADYRDQHRGGQDWRFLLRAAAVLIVAVSLPVIVFYVQPDGAPEQKMALEDAVDKPFALPESPQPVAMEAEALASRAEVEEYREEKAQESISGNSAESLSDPALIAGVEAQAEGGSGASTTFGYNAPSSSPDFNSRSKARLSDTRQSGQRELDSVDKDRIEPRLQDYLESQNSLVKLDTLIRPNAAPTFKQLAAELREAHIADSLKGLGKVGELAAAGDINPRAATQAGPVSDLLSEADESGFADDNEVAALRRQRSDTPAAAPAEASAKNTGLPQLLFRGQEGAISIVFQANAGQKKEDAKSNIQPQAIIPARIVERTDSSLAIILETSLHDFAAQPEEMSIIRLPEDIIELSLGSGPIYTIDISKDTTAALLKNLE